MRNTTRQDWQSQYLAQKGRAAHIHAYFIPTMTIGKLNNFFHFAAEKPKLGNKLSQEFWIPHLAKEATVIINPLNYASKVEDEEVAKLLLLVAGDIETNPGPMVGTFSFKYVLFHRIFPGSRHAARG